MTERCRHGLRAKWCVLCTSTEPVREETSESGVCGLCDLPGAPWCSECRQAVREELEAPAARLGFAVTAEMVERLLRRKTAMRRQKVSYQKTMQGKKK